MEVFYAYYFWDGCLPGTLSIPRHIGRCFTLVTISWLVWITDLHRLMDDTDLWITLYELRISPIYGLYKRWLVGWYQPGPVYIANYRWVIAATSNWGSVRQQMKGDCRGIKCSKIYEHRYWWRCLPELLAIPFFSWWITGLYGCLKASITRTR